MGSKEYFDRVAGQWDTMRQSFFSEEVREKAYQVAGVIAGKTAADIGAGSGFITEGLIARGMQVIAVDQSQAMLAELKVRFAASNQIDYRIGESEALPVSDQAVDYSLANMYLHHVESPAAAILEMTRILKPGGRLVITDLDEHDFSFLKTEHYDRWMGFRRDHVLQWLREAGLKNTGIDYVGQNCCAASSCGCEKAAIRIFVAWGDK